MNLKAGKYLLIKIGTFSYDFKYANKLASFSKKELEWVDAGGFFNAEMRLFTIIDGKIVRIKSNGAKWGK